MASAPRRIRGLGRRKKGRALCLFLDADAVALRPPCLATVHHPLSFRARLICPLPDVKADGGNFAIRVAAAGLLAAEPGFGMFQAPAGKNSAPLLPEIVAATGL